MKVNFGLPSSEITVTENASIAILNNTGGTKYKRGHIRVAVKGSGCNGYAYILEYVTEPEKDDLIFKNMGTTIVVDQKSYPYIKGLEVDFIKEGFSQGFIFNNPNATASCGCGESFSV